MNTKKIINQLKKKYRGGKIIINTPEFPLEIVCELDPISNTHSIAVIDFAMPHYHKINTEIYEVIKGELIVYCNGKTVLLKESERIKIPPFSIHQAVGKETWIHVYANPGWTLEDHILVKNIKDL